MESLIGPPSITQVSFRPPKKKDIQAKQMSKSLPDLAGCMSLCFQCQSQGTDSIIPDFQPFAAFSGPERIFFFITFLFELQFSE